MFDGKAFGDEVVAVVRAYVDRRIDDIEAARRGENAALRERAETLAAENADLVARVAALEADAATLREVRDGVVAMRATVDGLVIPDVSEFVSRAEAAAMQPDISGFATKAEVEAVRETIPELVDFAPQIVAAADRAAAEIAAVREAMPDASQFATIADIENIRGLIPEATDLCGFATKVEVEAVAARIVPPVDFGPEIAAVREAMPDASQFATIADLAAVRDAIPEPTDLSHLATKEDVHEAVSAIVIPEAIRGEDADPEVVAAIVRAGLDEFTAGIEHRVAERLASVRDGKDGTLPIVEAWSDRVHYAGSVVAHRGGTWQARQDTGREPPHGDWVCLAAAGESARGFTVRGTYAPDESYQALDIVMRDGSSFVATADNPGECPGDGWQLWASRGRTGKPGDPGQKGDPGDVTEAPVPVALVRDGGEIVLTMSDGQELRA